MDSKTLRPYHAHDLQAFAKFILSYSADDAEKKKKDEELMKAWNINQGEYMNIMFGDKCRKDIAACYMGQVKEFVTNETKTSLTKCLESADPQLDFVELLVNLAKKIKVRPYNYKEYEIDITKEENLIAIRNISDLEFLWKYNLKGGIALIVRRMAITDESQSVYIDLAQDKRQDELYRDAIDQTLFKLICEADAFNFSRFIVYAKN
jgi:hypothetical protein